MPNLNRLEGPVYIRVFSGEDYTGDVQYLRAGQYLDPVQIERIMQFASLRVPQGVLFQISGDNAVSKSIVGEMSIPKWLPLGWRVTEILVLRSDLIGENGNAFVDIDSSSTENLPNPRSTLTRISSGRAFIK